MAAAIATIQRVHLNDLDVDQITLTEPAKSKTGTTQTCRVLYQGKPFLVTLPPMEVPFTVSDFKKNGVGDKKYSASLSLDGAEQRPEIARAIKKLDDLEMRIIDQLILYGKSFFPQYKKSFTRAFFKNPDDPESWKIWPIVKRKGDYPPRMAVKLTTTGKDSTQFAGHRRTPMTVQKGQSGERVAATMDNIEELMPQGCIATCVVEMPSVLLTFNKFTLQIRLVRALVETVDDMDEFMAEGDMEEGEIVAEEEEEEQEETDDERIPTITR